MKNNNEILGEKMAEEFFDLVKKYGAVIDREELCSSLVGMTVLTTLTAFYGNFDSTKDFVEKWVTICLEKAKERIDE